MDDFDLNYINQSVPTNYKYNRASYVNSSQNVIIVRT